MPSGGSLATFAALSFVLVVVPGPSVLFVIGRAVSLGRRAALLTVAGNAAGVYAQVLLVAAGLGALVERSVVAFTAVKLVGALYLVWLGIQAVRHRTAPSVGIDAGARSARPPRAVFVEGFVVGVANPKFIVFFAAILPQYVVANGAPAGVQMAFLGLIAVAIALASDSVWGLAAGTARTWFARSPRRLGHLGAAGGTAMVGLGVKLALTGRND